MNKKKYKGKIGYCSAKTLGMSKGHYVYIRDVLGNGRCNVNIFTSLEEVRDNRRYFSFDKIDKVRKGYLYPVPKRDLSLPLWSAINLDGNINNVKISDIKHIGKEKMKSRHKFFVGKFTKK